MSNGSGQFARVVKEAQSHPISRERTGNRRYRCDYTTGGRNVVVLQVEYTEFVTTFEGKPGRWVCSWRDATTDDLTALEDGYYG